MSWFTFHHEAMATEFAIFITHSDSEYARQAAVAAWRELDALESELSRFIETSDIARANRLQPGETIPIGDDTLQCLLLAAEIATATDHAFDPAYASEHDFDGPPFTLDPDAHTLTSRARRLRLDLGAIGKGYALDRLAALLREWNLGHACVQSGGSTVLALDAPPDLPGWPIGIGDDNSQQTIHLTRMALSGSGIAVKGEHLLDPRTRRPATRTTRVWALAPGAAISDALSTAFYVMDDPAIAAFCEVHPEIGAAIATSPECLSTHGALRPYFQKSSHPL